MVTNVYTGVPGALDVRCPRCAAKAMFDSPFEVYWRRDMLPEGETRPTHKFGSGVVLEKYPSIRPWDSPGKKKLAGPPEGVVKCLHCGLVGLHVLEWPQDAYYRWDIRGNTLWAYNEAHARVLLAFLGSKERDVGRFPGYEKSLMKLPKEFITAKVRDDVVKAISETLKGEGA